MENRDPSSDRVGDHNESPAHAQNDKRDLPAERAARGIVIDAMSSAFDLSSPLPLQDIALEAIRRSGANAVCFTVPYPGDAVEATTRKIARVQAAVDAYEEDMLIVRCHADIERAGKMGKMGLILNFQNTEMLEDDLSRIEAFRRLDVLVMQMTYNTRTPFGDGCLEPTDKGLTPLGQQAISAMNELGVAVDLSHASPRTQAMGIAASTKPVLLSHTGCCALFDHPRNTTDSVLRSLVDRGGVVGIYLMPYLAGGTGPITADMLLDHIDHALHVCGADHVGIGSDLWVMPVDDNPTYRKRLREHIEKRQRLGISAPGECPDRPPFIPELNAFGRMELIGDAMAKRGHPARIIEKVLGNNFHRVLGEIWTL